MVNKITAQTEKGWTRKFPTAYGIYWARTPKAAKAFLMEFDRYGNWHFGSEVSTFDDELKRSDYEWLGPISPSDTEQLIRLRDWKESAMTILAQYDAVADSFGGRLGSSKMENLERGVEQLRKIAKEALRFRSEMNGPCNHEEYMTKLCTQCEIREALAQLQQS